MSQYIVQGIFVAAGIISLLAAIRSDTYRSVSILFSEYSANGIIKKDQYSLINKRKGAGFTICAFPFIN